MLPNNNKSFNADNDDYVEDNYDVNYVKPSDGVNAVPSGCQSSQGVSPD